MNKLKEVKSIWIVLFSFFLFGIVVTFLGIFTSSFTNDFAFTPESIINYSIGMDEELCRGANGAPDKVLSKVGLPVNTPGFFPAPKKHIESKVYIYDKTTYCIVVYFNKNGKCCFIHVGHT